MAYDKLTSKSLAQELCCSKATVDRALEQLGLQARNGKGFDLTPAAAGLGEESDGKYGAFLLWHRKVLVLLAPLCSPPTRDEYNALLARVERLEAGNA